MTKIHMTKLALLGATAFFAATSAHAQVADSWTIDGAVNVSALNTGDVISDPVTGGNIAGIDTAEITEGNKNSISAASVGASASSSFSTVNNSGLGGDAVITFGEVTAVAGNSGGVTNATDVLNSATIGAGNINSISLAAVGASASIGGSTTLSTDAGAAVGADETFSYTAGALIVSAGGADGTVDAADAAIGGNGGDVVLSLASGFAAPTVSGGNGNSISVAGLGSSASASFSAAVDGDGSILDAFDLSLADGAIISSANTGGIAVGLGDAVTSPAIAGGNANSISTAALGTSASFSLSAALSGGGQVTAFNAAVGELQLDATNSGGVSLGGAQDGASNVNFEEASIAGAGNSNSISAAALGSSGSVSFSNTVYDTGNGDGTTGDVSFEAITVNSTNSGDIANLANLNGGNIDGGAKNSISIAGIGASASQSISVTDNSGVAISGIVTAMGGDITLAAVNSGGVSVAGGGLGTPVIAAGFSNSISAAAVGASASQSVARTLLVTQ